MSESRELSPIGQVCSAIASAEFKSRIGQALPPGVSVDRFTRTALTAIQMNPDVVRADRQSLYNSVIRAAQDGLMPDGREGALVVYGVRENGQFVDKVQFQPMVAGVIKRFGEAGILAYAASVHKNDKIRVWNDDTGQHVQHDPDIFGERGDFIGVYAVARTPDGRTYVETMNQTDIARVAKSSKSKDRQTGEPKGPWKDWPDRMAQKSVLHRLGRRVPFKSGDKAGELLHSTLTADADLYDFDQTTGEIRGATPEPAPAPTGPRRPSVFQRVAEQVAERVPVTDVDAAFSDAGSAAQSADSADSSEGDF